MVQDIVKNAELFWGTFICSFLQYSRSWLQFISLRLSSLEVRLTSRDGTSQVKNLDYHVVVS